MKKRIASIMDTGKKKVGVAIVCFMLILTMGTGMAFAANSNASTSGNTFDYEENLRQVYAEIEQKNAEIEKAFRESNATIFAVYGQYGITYSKETNRLYYNGELVRYFEDNKNKDGTFSGTTFPNVDGNVDVHAVRDSTGKLIGVELYRKADFDARTKKIQNENGNVSVSGGTDNNSPSVNP
jgi:hypothetical protein